ncbi:MAG: S-layer homology domain-containing protein [Hyphomonadaceae bacterium]|nr:S-layer homology domain-containing protein [Clostridia bacterium]
MKFKLVALVLVICLFANLSVAVFAVNIVETFGILKYEYPEFIQKIKTGGATEADLASFLTDLQTDMNKTTVTKENFNRTLGTSLKSVITYRTHRPVMNALLTSFSKEIAQFMETQVIPDALLPLYTTMKSAIFDEKPPKQALVYKYELVLADSANFKLNYSQAAIDYMNNALNQAKLVLNNKDATKLEIEQAIALFDTQITAFATMKSFGGQIIFDDLGDVPWAIDAIKTLVAKHVVDGMGDYKFAPNNLVTREQFVKLLVAAFTSVDANAQCTFSDVKPGAWYYPYIATAQKIGLTKGFDDGTFGVSQTITRQDMTVLLNRASQYFKMTLPQKKEAITFVDAEQVSEYAKDAILAMQTAGIVNGMGDNKFAPQSSATRAMAAKMIYELYSILKEEK